MIDLDTKTFGNQHASVIIAPCDVQGVCDEVRKASESGRAIYPVGGSTMMDFGMPASRSGVSIDVRGLKHVIDYPARDMTVTVQAGITIAELQALLRSENQQLPVDVPCPARATLGGALAVNSSGPRRLGYGSFRDYVIGISAVNDAGELIKAGGRVVKNVAGYDLCKLFIGSFGTLGIISQVTLKVKPRPEARTFVAIGCPDQELAGLLDRLHCSRTRPTSITILNAEWAQLVGSREKEQLATMEWVLLVGFEDSRTAVAWQRQQLISELTIATPLVEEWADSSGYESILQNLADFSTRDPGSVVFKANLLPHAVAPTCQQLRQMPEIGALQAEAGSGIILGHMRQGISSEAANQALRSILKCAVEARGNLVVMRCPLSWRDLLPIWGQPREDLWLMRDVKKSLDPKNIFNPGRFLNDL